MTVALHKLLAVLGAALLLAAPSLVHAQGRGNAYGRIDVGIDAVESCLLSATAMRFSVTPPYTATPATTTASISVICTPNTDFEIKIDRGLHNQGNRRRMYNATANDYLGYRIYQDAARSIEWRDRGRRRIYSGNTGPTGTLNLTAYGETDPVNTVQAGVYRDTVTITIEF